MEKAKWLYESVTKLVTWQKDDNTKLDTKKCCKVYVGKNKHNYHWFVVYGGIKFELRYDENFKNYIRISLLRQENNLKRLYQEYGQSDKTLYQAKKYAMQYVNTNPNYNKLLFNDCQVFAVYLCDYLIDTSNMTPYVASISTASSKRGSVISKFTFTSACVKYDYDEHTKNYIAINDDRNGFIYEFIDLPSKSSQVAPSISVSSSEMLDEILENCFEESYKLSNDFIELNELEKNFQNKYFQVYFNDFQSNDCVNFQQFIRNNYGDVYDIISTFAYLIDEKFEYELKYSEDCSRDYKKCADYYATKIPTIKTYIFEKRSDIYEKDSYSNIFNCNNKLIKCNIISKLTSDDIQRHINIFYGSRYGDKSSSIYRDKSWSKYHEIAKKLCKDLNGQQILSLKWNEVISRFNKMTSDDRNIIYQILNSFYYPFEDANEFCKKMNENARNFSIYRYQEDAKSLIDNENNNYMVRTNIYKDCGLSLLIDYCLFPLQRPLFPNIICKFLPLKDVNALLQNHPYLSLNDVTTLNLYSCLHVVIWFKYPYRSLEMIKLLIAYGADITVKNGENETATDCAIKCSKTFKIKNCPILTFLQDTRLVDEIQQWL